MLDDGSGDGVLNTTVAAGSFGGACGVAVDTMTVGFSATTGLGCDGSTGAGTGASAFGFASAVDFSVAGFTSTHMGRASLGGGIDFTRSASSAEAIVMTFSEP